jgi:hypothetical protein
MKRALLIIAVALGMFGVAAVAMARHHHHYTPNPPNGAYYSADRTQNLSAARPRADEGHW